MMRRTAASVNGWNDDSDDDARLMTGGGARPEVDNATPETYKTPSGLAGMREVSREKREVD